jgi:hypothetical protein
VNTGSEDLLSWQQCLAELLVPPDVVYDEYIFVLHLPIAD